MELDHVAGLIKRVHNELEVNRDRAYGNGPAVRAAQYEAVGRIVAAIIIAESKNMETEL